MVPADVVVPTDVMAPTAVTVLGIIWLVTAVLASVVDEENIGDDMFAHCLS